MMSTLAMQEELTKALSANAQEMKELYAKICKRMRGSHACQAKDFAQLLADAITCVHKYKPNEALAKPLTKITHTRVRREKKV